MRSQKSGFYGRSTVAPKNPNRVFFNRTEPNPLIYRQMKVSSNWLLSSGTP